MICIRILDNKRFTIIRMFENYIKIFNKIFKLYKQLKYGSFCNKVFAKNVAIILKFNHR